MENRMATKVSMVEEYIASTREELKDIAIPKTAEVVAADIRSQIITGELQLGDHLQPEAQLMEEFSTSRATIREAFRILENEQFISLRRGARQGAEVHLPNAKMISRYAGYVLQTRSTPLKDLYTARYAIEPVAARMLADQSDPHTVKTLNKYIDEIESIVASGVSNSKELRLAFLHFHLRMVDLAGNNTLTLLQLTLEQVLERHQMRQETPQDYANASPEQLVKKAKDTLDAYRKLVRYIERGDSRRAADHWRDHVTEINANWLAGFEDTSIYEVMN
jgi:DNA-binding FadR family transcriptional regulator